MNLFVIIIGVILWGSFSKQSIVVEEEYAVNQQDSLPPRNGVVKVKELTAPNKKNQQESSTNKEKPRKNQSEKIADITKTKAWQKAQKEKERDTKKNASKEKTEKEPIVSKTSNSEGLTLEEEIKLLAKKEELDVDNKIHPDNEKNCRFAFDTTDEFTGVRKKGLAARTFFSYTPEEYRKFIKEGDFIRCEGYLSQSSGGDMALNIILYIASGDAKQKFGAIKSNSSMILRTMDSKEYYLMTYPGAAPQVVDNVTQYQCSFAISKSDIKSLKKSEIDQVKITFEKGFQVYDVYYLDFILDQFPCFE